MDVKAELVLLGGRLKEARERAGMEPGDVCEAMAQMDPWLSMSPKTLGNWEAGRNMPCLLQFRALCAIYGVLGHRILFATPPLGITKKEGVELRALAAGATPSLGRKIEIILSLIRMPDEAEA